MRILSCLRLFTCGVVTCCAVQAPTQTLIEAPPFEPTADEDAGSTGRSILPAPNDAMPLAGKPSESTVSGDAARLADLLRETHPWARFEPGAWRTVRTVSEAFDGDGIFAGQSQTERTERLIAVDESTYTLEMETVIALAGRNTPGPSETTRYSLLTDRPVDLGEPTVAEGEPTSIRIGEVMAPCGVWQLRRESPAGLVERTLFVSDEAVPMVLRRESQTTDPEGDLGTRRVMSVTRRHGPALYGDRLTDAWHATVQTTHEAGERTERQVIGGLEVPGGVFRESVAEYGASGQKSRWAVSKLVASGRSPDETIGAESEDEGPTVEVEVRPRRFLRMLRRGEEATTDL
ncbi:MAG: hypothetical protein AAF266_02975 [Planctomycetota bacterium]